jgi:hypothetical protein
MPYEGHHHAQVLRDAFANWLPTIEADWFITLNFNRPISIQGARSQLKGWLGRVDRSLLGRKWYQKPSSERTSGVATIENPDRNTHLHILLKFPPKAAELSTSALLTSTCGTWNKLEPQGQFHYELIWSMAGVAKYTCKQFTRIDHLENCLILFSEFHHSG